ELAAWAISRYEATLVEESKVRRAAAKHRRDAQIHAALYFLDPLLTYSCRGLTPLDRVALPILARRTNVVLVLGKSDLLSTRQAGRLRRWIADEIAEENGMRLYGFAGDAEETARIDRLLEELRMMSPFTVGSRAGSAAGGRRAATAFRTFPWGRADAHNPAHADVGALLHTLLASHRDRLRDITRDVFYEAWRTDKL
ncbi:hypothetical protein CXG81DRAFT_2116, partial [Caulochytrium protostelioides]